MKSINNQSRASFSAHYHLHQPGGANWRWDRRRSV